MPTQSRRHATRSMRRGVQSGVIRRLVAASAGRRRPAFRKPGPEDRKVVAREPDATCRVVGGVRFLRGSDWRLLVVGLALALDVGHSREDFVYEAVFEHFFFVEPF